MSYEEYLRKRDAYMASSAPPEIKEEAIRKLDELFNNRLNATVEYSEVKGEELDD